MANYTNPNIRIAMIQADLKQWELAKLLGISESTMCRILRSELSVEEQQTIIAKIREYKK
jgi:DNA-binding XRE family transcriptional regulator